MADCNGAPPVTERDVGSLQPPGQPEVRYPRLVLRGDQYPALPHGAGRNRQRRVGDARQPIELQVPQRLRIRLRHAPQNRRIRHQPPQIEHFENIITAPLDAA